MKKLFFLATILISIVGHCQLHGGMNYDKIDVVKGSSVSNKPAAIWIDSAYFESNNSTRKYALIFFGHGSGEAGIDTVSVTNHGMMNNLKLGERPYYFNGTDTIRFIVIACQRGSYGLDPSWFPGMFEDATKRFRIDSSRVYLTGISSGGWWSLGVITNNTDTTYNKYVSAIEVSSAAMQDIDTAGRHWLADRKIPLMLDAGDQTGDASYYDNQGFLVYQYLRVRWPSYNSPAPDTMVWRGYGHDHFEQRVAATTPWPKVSNKNIYQWFGQYRNSAGSAPPVDPNACNTAPPQTYVLTQTATNEIYHPDGGGQLANVKGGDTLKIPALAGGASYVDIILQNFRGDSCHPIIITNTGGVVKANFVRIENAAWFKFLGNGVPGTTYGFVLGAANVSNSLGIGICNHFEVAYTDVGNLADVGMLIKKNPILGDSLTNYPNYIMRKIRLHHNWVHNTTGEGLYIGHTYPYSDPYNNNLTPIRLDSVRIDHNLVQHTGWDGIQLSNALNGCSIDSNYVYDYGYLDYGSQRAGIIMGANTQGSIYADTVIKGTGNGIQMFGYGVMEIHHNYLDSTGRTQELNGPGGSKVGEQDFFSNDDSNRIEGIKPPLRLRIHDNIIHHQQVNKLIYTIVDQAQSDSLLWANNTVCMTSDTTNWKVAYFAVGQPLKNITHLTILTNCGSVAPPPPAPPSYTRTYRQYFIRRLKKK
jgi:hypothetical protein